jgi:hypothetical protein
MTKHALRSARPDCLPGLSWAELSWMSQGCILLVAVTLREELL